MKIYFAPEQQTQKWALSLRLIRFYATLFK